MGGTAGAFFRKGYTFPAGPLGVTVPDFILDTLVSCGAKDLPEFERSNFQLKTRELDLIISKPLEDLEKELKGLFPDDSQGIRKVIEYIKSWITEGGKGYSDFEKINEQPPQHEKPGIPAKEFLGKHLTNKTLINLLGSQGAEEPVMSLSLLVQMWDFLSETGIWYPSCGIYGLPLLLKDAFEKSGGIIQFNNKVVRIITENKKAVGVRMDGGEEILAPIIVSNVDYGKTITQLLPEDVLPKDFLSRTIKRPLTGSVISLSLGVDPSKIDFSAMKAPNMLYKSNDPEPEDWKDRAESMDFFKDDQIWISRLSLHDKNLATEGREVIVIRADAPYEYFAKYRKDPRPHKVDYYEFKEFLARALLETADEILPGLKSAVEVMDLATPLTYEFWGHRKNGSVAGWSWSLGHNVNLANPPIDGLHMVGILSFTRLFMGGMGTSMYSGRWVAREILEK